MPIAIEPLVMDMMRRKLKFELRNSASGTIGSGALRSTATHAMAQTMPNVTIPKLWGEKLDPKISRLSATRTMLIVTAASNNAPT